ncbi:MAG: hypothetical protein ABIC18_02385 [Candidatus Omnitrophota bacterium]
MRIKVGKSRGIFKLRDKTCPFLYQKSGRGLNDSWDKIQTNYNCRLPPGKGGI